MALNAQTSLFLFPVDSAGRETITSDMTASGSRYNPSDEIPFATPSKFKDDDSTSHDPRAPTMLQIVVSHVLQMRATSILLIM